MIRSGSGALLARAAFAQIAGALTAVLCHAAGLATGNLLLGIAGVVAGASALALRMPRWWSAICLLFPPALGLAAGLDLPASVPAIALLGSLLLFGTVMLSRVPLWLSGRRARAQLCAHLPELFPTRHDLDAVDLGGGLGGLLLALWRSGRCARLTGIEWAPLPFLFGGLRLRVAGWPGRWRFGSFWRHDLGPHDLVYAFLSPAAMPQLWDKACAEMRPGSCLVSYRFVIPDVAPDQRLQVGEREEDALLIWRMPGAHDAADPHDAPTS